MHLRRIGGGDIRWIADEDVPIFNLLLCRERVQKIGDSEADATGCVQRDRILLCNLERRRGEIEGEHLSLGKMKGQRNRNGTRARADIDDLKAPVVRHALKNSFDQMLGLRAWDQYRRRNAKGKAIELLRARNVLHRLMRNTALDELAVTAKLFRTELASGIREQSRPRDARGLQHERLRHPAGHSREDIHRQQKALRRIGLPVEAS